MHASSLFEFCIWLALSLQSGIQITGVYKGFLHQVLFELSSTFQCCVCFQDNSKLYLNLLDLELSGDLRLNGGGVQQCVSKALAAPLSSDSKILFSQRGLQFAEDFGTTVQRSEFRTTLVF